MRFILSLLINRVGRPYDMLLSSKQDIFILAEGKILKQVVTKLLGTTVTNTVTEYIIINDTVLFNDNQWCWYFTKIKIRLHVI